MTGSPRTAGDPAHAIPRCGRPLGISLLIYLFWFWAGATVVLVLGLALGDGPVTVYGEPTPRGDVLGAVLPAVIPMGLAATGAALALGLARSWARPAALFPFALAAFGPALTGLGSGSPSELGLAALVLLPILGLLTAYLYFRPGPREYFRRSNR